MYKNKNSNGKNNLCGEKIGLQGIDLDKNAIQRIECGKRFVTDIELKAFAQILNTTADELLKE